MKKVLVLTLVLGMASLANAGLLYTATATAPFEITITYMDTADLACDVYIDYTTFASSGFDINAATLTGSGASIANLLILTSAVDSIDAYYLALGNTSNWATGTVLGVLDLNGAAPNVGGTPITMDLYDGNASPSGQVTVMVPEPMTMGILSLGALFIRKKK